MSKEVIEYSTRIFVGGMKSGRAFNKPVGEAELREVFGRYGNVVNIKSGVKDFAFIDYEDMASCERAIEAMHDKPFDSFSTGPMKVCLANPQEDRRRGPALHRRSRSRSRDRSNHPGGGGGGYHPRDASPFMRGNPPREHPPHRGGPLTRSRSRSRPRALPDARPPPPQHHHAIGMRDGRSRDRSHDRGGAGRGPPPRADSLPAGHSRDEYGAGGDRYLPRGGGGGDFPRAEHAGRGPGQYGGMGGGRDGGRDEGRDFHGDRDGPHGYGYGGGGRRGPEPGPNWREGPPGRPYPDDRHYPGGSSYPPAGDRSRSRSRGPPGRAGSGGYPQDRRGGPGGVAGGGGYSGRNDHPDRPGGGGAASRYDTDAAGWHSGRGPADSRYPPAVADRGGGGGRARGPSPPRPAAPSSAGGGVHEPRGGGGGDVYGTGRGREGGGDEEGISVRVTLDTADWGHQAAGEEELTEQEQVRRRRREMRFGGSAGGQAAGGQGPDGYAAGGAGPGRDEGAYDPYHPYGGGDSGGAM